MRLRQFFDEGALVIPPFFLSFPHHDTGNAKISWGDSGGGHCELERWCFIIVTLPDGSWLGKTSWFIIFSIVYITYQAKKQHKNRTLDIVK